MSPAQPTPPASAQSRRPSAPCSASPGRTSCRRGEPRGSQARGSSRCTSRRELTSLSLAQIARQFDRDHSTVLHAIRTVSGRLDPDSDTSAVLHRVHQLLATQTDPAVTEPGLLHQPTTLSTPAVRRLIAHHPTMSSTSPQPSTAVNTSEIDRKMQDSPMKLSISRDILLRRSSARGSRGLHPFDAAIARRREARPPVPTNSSSPLRIPRSA